MSDKRRVSYFDTTSVAAMVGFGLYWAWIDLTLFSSPLTFGGVDQSILFSRYSSLVCLPFAIAFFAIVLSFCQDFGARSLRQRLIVGAISLAGASGSLLLAWGAQQSEALFGVGLAINGLTMGAMTLVWAEVYARDGQNRGSVWVPGSIAFSCVVYLIVMNLTGGLRVAVLGAMPLLSMGAAWVLSHQEEDNPDSVNRAAEYDLMDPVPRGLLASVLPWRFALLLVSYSAYFGVMMFLYATPGASASGGSDGARFLARGATCLLFFVGMSVFGWKPRIAYKASILVIIAGFLFLPFLFNGYGYVIEIIAHIGYGCFDCMIWAVLFGLVKSQRASTTVVTGLVRILTAAGTFVAALAVIALTVSVSLTAEQMTALSSSLVYLIVIILMLVLNDGRPDALWGALDEAEPSREESRSWAMVEEFGVRHGLSDREREVLHPLVQGRSMPVIAEGLSISLNTVKSHVRHIYQKVAVGNKQELIDRLEEEAPGR